MAQRVFFRLLSFWLVKLSHPPPAPTPHPPKKTTKKIILLYHLQILAKAPPAICKSLPSPCPSFEIIILMHKPCMYPIVISFGEQKWQISCKSSQVDYTLIPEADA